MSLFSPSIQLSAFRKNISDNIATAVTIMLKRQIDNSHDISDVTLSPAYGISFQTIYLASSRQTHFSPQSHLGIMQIDQGLHDYYRQ